MIIPNQAAAKVTRTASLQTRTYWVSLAKSLTRGEPVNLKGVAG